MEKLISIIEKTLVPVANKLSQNKYLSAISGGCMSTLGIIMVGAVFTILTNISWQPYFLFRNKRSFCGITCRAYCI